jgi:hypothetical protein
MGFSVKRKREEKQRWGEHGTDELGTRNAERGARKRRRPISTPRRRDLKGVNTEQMNAERGNDEDGV